MTGPANPPGLSEIAYRAGDFTSFRRALLAPLPGEQQLASWSPSPGDLGLQVLEWWAYLADILTFYNEQIANNSYLRTAAGPQGPPERNVAGLVRLLGYLPRPGTTAHGVLAAIRGPGAPEEELVLPAGLQVISTPTASTPAQVFETGDTASFPGPSDVPISLPPDTHLFQPTGAGPAEAGAAGRARCRPARRSLVLVKQGWDGSTRDWALTTVRSVTAETDPDGSANTRVVLDSGDWTGITEAQPQATDYQLLKATATAQLWTLAAPAAVPDTRPGAAAVLPEDQVPVPLATVVRGVAPGDDVLFTGLPPILAQVVGSTDEVITVRPGTTAIPPVLVPRTTLQVRATDAASLGTAIDNPDDVPGIAMRYGLREAGTLIPTPATTLTQLEVTVTAPAGLVLPADGTVALQDATGAGQLVTASRPSADTATLSAMDGEPAQLDPPLQAPIVLLADLVQVSGGTAVQGEVLGDGDATAAGQVFTLAHSPLVYLPPAQQGDPPGSTLTVTVDGAPWSPVPSFYRQQPDARVYLVRALPDGTTQVCFGDGVNGARLPTGTGNVAASYRYGPAGQPPPPGRLSTVLKPQPNLATVRNPVPLTPGTDPEAAAQTAENAPSTAVLLGAAISPRDCAAGRRHDRGRHPGKGLLGLGSGPAVPGDHALHRWRRQRRRGGAGPASALAVAHRGAAGESRRPDHHLPARPSAREQTRGRSGTDARRSPHRPGHRAVQPGPHGDRAAPVPQPGGGRPDGRRRQRRPAAADRARHPR